MTIRAPDQSRSQQVFDVITVLLTIGNEEIHRRREARHNETLFDEYDNEDDGYDYIKHITETIERVREIEKALLFMTKTLVFQEMMKVK
jgi:hypothetical protein